MNNFKRTLFILIIVLFLGFIGTKFLLTILKNDNPSLMNSAEEITLSKGDYLIGHDLEPGFYDVEALSDNVFFMPVKFSKGDQILGQRLEKNSHTFIEGKGKVRLSPAKYEVLTINENNEYVIKNSGNYMVGKQIPEGKYKISYYVKDGKKVNKNPFIQVLPGYGENTLDSTNFQEKDSYNVYLKIGYVLEIHKSLTEEYNGVVFILNPL